MERPAKTALADPVKIHVAPYRYLCGGQLTRCVSQPGTAARLDAQGDKIMQRLVYRNFGDHESIVAVHSIDTSEGGGGVRWYEFRLNAQRAPGVVPAGHLRPRRVLSLDGQRRAWTARATSPSGYSFGGAPNYAGQRFAARLAGDPLGQLTLAETELAEGAAAQTYGNRWEDYATLPWTLPTTAPSGTWATITGPARPRIPRASELSACPAVSSIA